MGKRKQDPWALVIFGPYRNKLSDAVCNTVPPVAKLLQYSTSLTGLGKKGT